jgi:hypothetical protein
MLTTESAAPAAATLPLFLPQAPPDRVSSLFHAATSLGQLLGDGLACERERMTAEGAKAGLTYSRSLIVDPSVIVPALPPCQARSPTCRRCWRRRAGWLWSRPHASMP